MMKRSIAIYVKRKIKRGNGKRKKEEKMKIVIKMRMKRKKEDKQISWLNYWIYGLSTLTHSINKR